MARRFQINLVSGLDTIASKMFNCLNINVEGAKQVRMKVKPAQRITAWMAYLALVAAAFAAHACAVERDEQAMPATTATHSA